MAKKLPHTSKQMKNRILDEAIKCFAKKGFEGTSIQEIAEAVGIRRPSILYHFQTKEKLREEVLHYLINMWTKEIPRILITAQDGEDRFTSIAMSLVDLFTEDRNRAFYMIREMLDKPDEIGPIVSYAIKPWKLLLVEYIRLGKMMGTIRKDVTPQTFLGAVLILILGIVTFGRTISDIFEIEPATSNDPLIRELLRLTKTSLYHDKNPARRKKTDASRR